MQIGALTAFLSYLMQILMSVMMATFMLMMVPRAAVCAERIGEVLDTESSVVAAGRARSPSVPRPRRARAARRRVPLPGRRGAGAARHHASAPRPGETTAVIGSTGAGKTTLLSLVPRLFDATGGAVLVDGVDVRELDPDVLWSRIGARAAAAVPVLRHGRQQPALRQPGRHRRGAVARPGDRPGPRLRRGDAGAAWTRRSRRAAPTSPAASGSGWRSPGRWSAGRRSTCSTTRSPRSTSPPTPRCGRRCGRSPPTPRSSSSPSGCPPSSTPTRSSCSRTARSSASARHDELLDDLPDVRRDRGVPAHRWRRRHERNEPNGAADRAVDRRPAAGRPRPAAAAAVRRG